MQCIEDEGVNHCAIALSPAQKCFKSAEIQTAADMADKSVQFFSLTNNASYLYQAWIRTNVKIYLLIYILQNTILLQCYKFIQSTFIIVLCLIRPVKIQLDNVYRHNCLTCKVYVYIPAFIDLYDIGSNKSVSYRLNRGKCGADFYRPRVHLCYQN